MTGPKEFGELAQTLVKRWRGKTSQRAMSEVLGFQSNVVGHWEAGRRYPLTSKALEMAEMASPGCLKRMVREVRPNDPDSIDLTDTVGVSLFLGDLIAHRPISVVATRVGVSRQTMSRWLGGDIEPRLPDFLSVLRATRWLSRIVIHLCPEIPLIHRPPAGWKVHLQRVLGALMLEPNPIHITDPIRSLSQITRRTPEEVAQDLEDLEELGLIRWEGKRWTIHIRSQMYDTSGSGRSSSMVADFAEVLTRGPANNSHITLATCSTRDRERIVRILERAQAEIRDVLYASTESSELFYVGLVTARLYSESSSGSPVKE